MTEEEARHVELVRAIEEEDTEATFLTREDLARAENHALAVSASLKGKRRADAFIAGRAAFASARLATRHPGIAALVARSHWRRWPIVAVSVLALAAGFVSNEFGTSKRLDLLAVPLLGTIAWNALIYLWLLFAIFKRKTVTVAHPLYGAFMRIATIGHRGFDFGTPWHRAANKFQSRWSRASIPLVAARITATLHLGAALFAGGLVGGIYLRALVIEYHAGWESTFLGPGTVHTLLSIVLGPASWATHVPIPTAEAVAAMRWTGPKSSGVNAAPWIHLYTATLLGMVIVPRLLLALWQGLKAFRLSRRFPVPGREDFYIRRLLRTTGGVPSIIRITPYAYRPDEQTSSRLTTALRAALGDGTQVRFDVPVDYGAEDRWLAEHPGDPQDDYHILLFTLSATPEEENHGALAAALAARNARGGSGTILAALIDEGPYRAHFAGQSGIDERIAGRLDSWRRMLSASGLDPLGLNLSTDVDADLAQRLEGGLLPDGAMHG